VTSDRELCPALVVVVVVVVVVVTIYHDGDLLPATAKPDGRLSYETTKLAISDPDYEEGRGGKKGEEGGSFAAMSNPEG